MAYRWSIPVRKPNLSKPAEAPVEAVVEEENTTTEESETPAAVKPKATAPRKPRKEK